MVFGRPARRTFQNLFGKWIVSEQDDKTFLTRFSLVLTGLVIFAIVIVVLAVQMDQKLADSDNPAQEQAKVERIDPVFAVYAGETGRAAALAAAEAASAAKPVQVAFDGSTDGEMIYSNVCQACHMSGAAGAPRLVPEDWTERLSKGTETLVSHAINGFNAMPAKGGRTDLTDEQVRAAVEYMLGQVQ